jgi:cystathionine beta-lyase
MNYNFDKIIDRKDTDSLKYGGLKERYGCENLLPMWIADMDFAVAPEIVKALADRVQHAVFGYTFASDDYFNAIINWQKRRHNFEITKNEICFVSGIVKGLAFAVDCFTRENDKIIIQPPVYQPFFIVPTSHNRQIVANPLIFDGEQYKMDFAGLENIASQNDCKMLILSNPHNPGGRVWNREELALLAEICHKHNILVVSDEIHSDLTFGKHVHIPFATVSDLAAQNSITFNSPSKTFNIAGFASSYSIIKNENLRKKFHKYLEISELCNGTIFQYLIVQAAYNNCENWLEELKTYIWENIMFADRFLKNNIPQIKTVIPHASFLLWLDCRALQLKQNQLVALFTNKAELALNNGAMFGEQGEGFMRLNIGCPRSVLAAALEKLGKAIK